MSAAARARYIELRREAHALASAIVTVVGKRREKDPDWQHVGDLARLRDQLHEIAVALACPPNGSEVEASTRVAAALAQPGLVGRRALLSLLERAP